MKCELNPLMEAKIQNALKGYKVAWKSNERIFEEMCFCLLTPQSSAKKAIKTINLLKENNLLEKGTAEEKQPFLKNIRFYITKSFRLEKVQEKFPKEKIKQILKDNEIETDIKKCREFLINNVNGYGMKEASHFLRNIGFFKEIAILDRHILKNLVKCNVIKEIPKNMNKKNYLKIEEKMKKYCEKNNIKIEKLDLVFWSSETGEVLK